MMNENIVKHLQACIDSFDKNQDCYIAKVTVVNLTELRASATSKMFEDGAPVVKYFDRDNIKTKITLRPNNGYLMVHSSGYPNYSYSHFYLYNEDVNTWYKIDAIKEDLEDDENFIIENFDISDRTCMDS